MVLCIIAFFAFSVMSIFSPRYRPLTKEAFTCVFNKATMKPCEPGLDDKYKAEIISSLLKVSPSVAKFTNKNFLAISISLFVVFVLGFLLVIASVLNFSI